MNDIANRLNALLPHLSGTPALAIVLTIAAYLVSIRIFPRLGQPVWCPPVLLASLLLAAALVVLSIDHREYAASASWISFLLGPATVALGIPLYTQMRHIRALWRPIVVTVPLAATFAAIYAVVLAHWLGANDEVIASIAPKSVTAPIAIGIAEEIGGSVPLLMGGLLATGIVTTLFVDLLAARVGVTDHRLLGLTLGINGHAIGTVRAFEISPLAGAFASLGMGLTGLFTAILLPLVMLYS
ncbi:LrgB family protein [Marinobacter sp. X15-166B]|uniref:LrgB family protein n=1 Tax=Marinobacter sp. X15-166B TaxID=1897620 RepID=UPI00085CACD2|nr:LrgB family protein [Marinobacter sp. X15-166B]OEY65351.1 hypothetical protein BG841_02010 [Marinobacter sp. X15-166B]